MPILPVTWLGLAPLRVIALQATAPELPPEPVTGLAPQARDYLSSSRRARRSELSKRKWLDNDSSSPPYPVFSAAIWHGVATWPSGFVQMEITAQDTIPELHDIDALAIWKWPRLYPKFPIWTLGSRIIRFSCPRHNESATRGSLSAQVGNWLQGICKEIQSGGMPLSSFVIIHWNANLSPDDIRVACGWTELQRQQIQTGSAPAAGTSPDS